jgi:hypothetical protein
MDHPARHFFPPSSHSFCFPSARIDSALTANLYVYLPDVPRFDHERRFDPQEVDLLIEPIRTFWAQLEIEVPCQMREDDTHLVTSQTVQERQQSTCS